MAKFPMDNGLPYKGFLDTMTGLHDLVLESCEKYPYSIAVTYDDGSVIQTITYKELLARSKEIVSVLNNFSMKNGVLGICVSENVNLPSLLLGVLSSNVAFYYFDSGPLQFIYHSVTDIGVRYVLIDADKLLELEELIYSLHGCIRHHHSLPQWNLVFIELLDVTEKKYHRSQLSYCITTSGTTGEPEIVRVPSQCIVPNILHLRDIYGMKDSDCVFLTSRLTFDPSIVDLFVALSCGAELLVVPHKIKMIPEKLVQMLHCRHKVTVMQPTPSLVSRINSQLLRTTILSENTSLRILAFGGEKFPSVSVLHSWREPGNKTTFINLYGITEVSSWAMYHVITEQDIRDQVSSIPLGKPLEKTTFAVKDLQGNVVKDGEGQLFVGSQHRYCLIGDETEGCSQYMRATGDWVEIKDNTVTYLYRIDDQIKRNGQRLDPSAIENVVSSIKEISDCRIVFKQEKLILVAVPYSQENNENLRKQIGRTVRDRLPYWYCPDYIILLSNLPITNHGKLDENAVMDSCSRICATLQENANDILLLVKNLWVESLGFGFSEFNENQNYLECGGNSLKAVALINKLEAVLKCELPQLLDNVLKNKFSDVLTYVKVSRLKESHMSTDEQLDFSPSRTKMLKNYRKFTNIDSEKENIVYNSKQDENDNEAASLLSIDVSSLHDYKNITDLFSPESKHERLSYENCWLTENEHLKREWDENRESMCQCKKVKKLGSVMKLSKYKNNSAFIYSVSRGSKWTKIIDKENQFAAKVYNYRKPPVLKECWRFDTRKCVDASPLVAVARFSQSVVYIGSHSHKFFAISLDTGEEIWSVMLGDRIESSASLSRCGKYVIVGCYDYYMYVIHTDSGEIYWRYKTDGEVKSSPTVDDTSSLVYIGSHDQHLHAVDIQTKTCIWKTYCNGGSLFSSPVIFKEKSAVFSATLGGNLLCIDQSLGVVRWSYLVGKPLFSTPAVTDEGVFIGCVDGKIHHISHAGQEVWQFPTRAPVFSIPIYIARKDKHSLNESSFIIGSHDNHLYCVSAVSGKELWNFETDHPVYSTPCIFKMSSMLQNLNTSEEMHLYATDNNFNQNKCIGVYGKEDSNHVEPSCVRTDDSVESDVADSENVVCCCSTKGTVYLLNSCTGDLMMQYSLPGEVFSSPVFAEGKLLVGCRDDFVYCFNTFSDPG